MKVIVENLAKICLDDIFQYNIQYSLKNALETDIGISQCFYDLGSSHILGRIFQKYQISILENLFIINFEIHIV